MLLYDYQMSLNEKQTNENDQVTCVKLRGFFFISPIDGLISLLMSHCNRDFPFSTSTTYFVSFIGPEPINQNQNNSKVDK